MTTNGEKRSLKIYCWIFYALFLISWMFLVHRDYRWSACELNLPKTSNIIDVWHQLTPVPKFLTVAILYITLHFLVTLVIKILKSKGGKSN